MIHPAGQRPPRVGAWPGRSRPARRRALDPAGRRPAQRRREDGGGGPRGRCCHLRPAPGMAEPARAAHLGVLVEKWGLKPNPDRRLPTCWGGRLGETRGWGSPDSPGHTLNILT
ncbi:translation initiation factor IF-2-like [Balaenoptera musculus]|uniref:Translation initiation factor IF-2-like n=1 Tax=Balaenoptera musculus TaxID=9771 RepID=A0A8B8VL39_BALMU|nr:translation initiation factor IF-2-like [Balaenoptera musculus]